MIRENNSQNNSHIKRGLKGSVLFTVLVVMVVMLTLTVVTIGLASEASRRSYANYNDHQTTSTARSVVDSVIDAMTNDENKALATAILDNVESAGEDGIEVNVTHGGSKNLGDGFGTVESLVFTYVGKDEAGSPADKCYYIEGTGQKIIKITATVLQGGERNTYSQYVIGDRLKNKKSSSGGGLIALGGYSGSESPLLNAHSPAYIGISEEFDITDNAKNKVNEDGTGDEKIVRFTDDTKYNSMLINSSFENKTNPQIMLSGGEGVSIMGNLDIWNTYKLSTTYTPGTGSSLKDYPYIYARGALNLAGSMTVGSSDHPVNIYCGRFLYTGNGEINSSNVNIYCYNTENTLSRADMYSRTDVASYAKSNWSQLGNSSNGSRLLNWAGGALGEKYKTGNFCTKGNLYMLGKVNMDGDVYVGGDLYIGEFAEDPVVGRIFVNGKVRIAKDKINDGRLQKLNKKIYCKNDVKYYDPSNGDSESDVTYLFTTPGSTEETANDALTEGKKFVFYDYTKATLPGYITAFITGDVSDLSDVVITADSVKGSMYDEEGHYKNAINESEGLISGASYYVYTGGDAGVINAKTITGTAAPEGIIKNDSVAIGSGTYSYNAKIIDSCMLTGKFHGINFYIDPVTTTDKVWINVHNAEFTSCNFIVNDSKAEVIFFMPTDKAQIKGGTTEDTDENIIEAKTKYYELVAAAGETYADYNNYMCFKSSCVILTKDYITHLSGDTSLEMVKYPLKDDDADNDWMLAKVTVCAPEGEDPNVLFETDNPITISGDICIPNGCIHIEKGGIAKDSDISGLSFKFKYPADFKYNDGTVIDKPVGCFGSIIAGHFKKLNNEFDTYYIDDPADSEPVKVTSGGYKWAPMPGYANF